MASKPSDGWKKGPLPPDTWNWGGVVPVGHTGGGFYFADFRGDHAVINPYSKDERILKADEVAWYNNSLELPPGDPHRVVILTRY